MKLAMFMNQIAYIFEKVELRLFRYRHLKSWRIKIR